MAELKVGSVPLGQYDLDHFLVMTRLARGSIRANVGSILTNYVRRKWGEYENILWYTAEKGGISKDECYKRLLEGESVAQILGEPTQMEPDADIAEMT
jgi:hypothetical protein